MEIKLLTIKEYAKKKNITYEAVRKQIQKYKDDELKDHIIKKNKTQYLDEYAVDFLDNRRRESPVLLYQMEKDEQIETLRNEKEALLITVANQANKISELEAWKADNALAIAEANQRQLLLEEKTEQIEALVQEKTLLEGFIQDAKNEIEAQKAEKADLSDEKDFYMQKGAEALEKAEKASNELTAAREALEVERKRREELENRTFGDYLKTLFRKKRKE